MPRVRRNNKELVFKRHARTLLRGLKLEIWHGSAGRIGKSISAIIRIYTNVTVPEKRDLVAQNKKN